MRHLFLLLLLALPCLVSCVRDRNRDVGPLARTASDSSAREEFQTHIPPGGD